MPGPGRQPRGMKSQVKNPGELFLRLMKYVLKDYKFHCISVVVLIVVSVLCNVQGTMFMKNLIDEYITPFLLSDNPNFTPLAHAIAKVAAFYALGVLATFGYNRLMVNVTQGTLRNLRNDLFSHMENAPCGFTCCNFTPAALHIPPIALIWYSVYAFASSLEIAMLLRPNPIRSGSPGWAPTAIPASFALWIVSIITTGSDA